MKRFKHSLSNYKLATFDMGHLIPVGHYEVLPGDSVRQATSALLRVSPLLTPVMHPVSVRIHHWFVPYRVLWSGWEDFITGVSPNQPPQATPGVSVGNLADYLGLPLGNTSPVLMFPFRAYNLIYNEFYRDQDLQAEVNLDTSAVHKVAWEKDYFTAARPWTQKGPDITIPITGLAPVKGIGFRSSTPPGSQSDVPVNQTELDNDTYGLAAASNSADILFRKDAADNDYPSIYADLSEATQANVNDFRLAFALQRYQEARAQYGSRYTEYLRYLGVRSSDARLQRPEYLGGGRSTISFSEVLRTGTESAAETGASVVGEMKGHGISAMRTRSFVRFFEEHGIVMSLASVRPRSMYTDGLHRSWNRRTKEDYWQKELEQIGQQPVLQKEVYGQSATPEAVFGYQDRYAEYRHMPSTVHGEFRTTLNDWHLARSFAADPVLNSSFIECVPSKRIHAEQTGHSLWTMFSHSIQARRMVGNKTIGRIV